MAEVRTGEATAAGRAGRVRSGPAAPVDELRAARFTLVDADGAVRGTLGASSDGSLGLRLQDRAERTRAELSLDASGATNLMLRDADGEVRSWLAVGRHGDPSLYLHGVSRHRTGLHGHAKLSVDEHGCPVLSLHDGHGRPRVLLSLDETGMATISCTDARGNPRVIVADDGSGPLRVLRPAEPSRDVPRLPLGERPGPGPDPRIATLADRVARLERPPRRRRGLVAAVVAAVALGAGAVGARLAAPTPAPAASPPARVAIAGPVIRAEELLLTDAAGTTRARLAVLPDGTPLLWMSDPAAKSTVELSVVPETGAVLRLGGGRSSIALVAPPHDLPSVGAYDGKDVLFQAPSNVARFLPSDLWP
jgi:hypothetical protein